MTQKTQIITAIDVDSVAAAQALTKTLQGTTLFKFGLEFAEVCGPQGLAELDLPEYSIFLDHKWSDISNTVGKAALAALKHIRPAIVNVHAMGGPKMMATAVKAIKNESPETKVIAVTVLTSIDAAELSSILNRKMTEQDLSEYVLHLAELAQSSDCDGVVCSGHEIAAIKNACGYDFLTVVPGIRPKGSAANDQQRIMKPKQASDLGADFLVMGRPITGADNPLQAAQDINLSMQ